jgi:hypothetical protein
MSSIGRSQIVYTIGCSSSASRAIWPPAITGRELVRIMKSHSFPALDLTP